MTDQRLPARYTQLLNCRDYLFFVLCGGHRAPFWKYKCAGLLDSAVEISQRLVTQDPPGLALETRYHLRQLKVAVEKLHIDDIDDFYSALDHLEEVLDCFKPAFEAITNGEANGR